MVTPFTDSLDPIKLYEYRAVGRPVVSTAVAGFRDAVDARTTVVDRAVFASAVVDRIRSSPVVVPGPGETPVPTWTDRVGQFAQVLARVASGQGMAGPVADRPGDGRPCG